MRLVANRSALGAVVEKGIAARSHSEVTNVLIEDRIAQQLAGRNNSSVEVWRPSCSAPQPLVIELTTLCLMPPPAKTVKAVQAGVKRKLLAMNMSMSSLRSSVYCVGLDLSSRGYQVKPEMYMVFVDTYIPT